VQRLRLSGKVRADLTITAGAVGLGTAGWLVDVALGLAIWSVAALAVGLFWIDVDDKRRR